MPTVNNIGFTTPTISFEEFKTKAEDLTARMSVLNELLKEADKLVQQVDHDSFDDEQQDDAYNLAHDIAHAANAQFDSFGPNGGFWLPSTC
jgi:hypothetical protein